MTFLMIVGGISLLLAGVGMVFVRKQKEISGGKAFVKVVSGGLMVLNVMVVIGFLVASPVYAQDAPSTSEKVTVSAEKVSTGYGLGLLSAAIAVAVGALGGGIAVAMAASAGMGALAENPKLFGNILIFVGLAEGIAIYGLIVALFILQKL
jgi:V/A-type H+-transporting ATPase subunit K